MKIQNLLSIPTDTSGIKLTAILMAIAVLFGIALRLIWVYQFHDVPEFHHNDQLMINTNDGYFWAEGARDILEDPDQPDELSPVNRSVPVITAFLAKAFPFISFETLILYMPAVFGALLAIPIILIGRSLGHTWLGFGAALLGVIAWSYYNRTMTGYYDDDLLQVTLPLLALWSIIWGVREHKTRYLIAVSLTTIASLWYYPGGYSLHLSLAIMLLLYTLIFDRKNHLNYKLFGFALLATAAIPVWLTLALSIGALAFFILLKERADRFIWPFVAAAVAILGFSGAFDPVISQLNQYVFRPEAVSDAAKLQFFHVVQTVREAGAIPFDVFSGRISGHWLTFLFACTGTAMMMVRYPVMLLALPFVGLGFLAYGVPGLIPPAGLRFTIYAVPVLALGLFYLIFWVGSKIPDLKLRVAAIALLGAAAIAPNVHHIWHYKVPTVFNSHEVQQLEKLSDTLTPRHDYVISWWDYGYPIRYYSYAKVLIDGGKHTGANNFPVSFALTTPNQLAAANMARLAVEYTEMGFEAHREGDRRSGSIIAQMMEDYDFTDSNRFLESIGREDFPAPAVTRDIYFYLPYRMADIYQTVALFSNRDLMTGRQGGQPFFAHARFTGEDGQLIRMDNGMAIDKQRGELVLGQQRLRIGEFFTAGYTPDGRYLTNPQRLNRNGQVSVVFMQHLNAFFIADPITFASPFVQLFALENYDPNLFEPVKSGPLAKIYRLKR
jgi:dolichyl-diphosphooligosaccharide--protein glycosyltransferase/undecaprenyl-diphosphooligosaccharide--protein glycosyltransferase